MCFRFDRCQNQIDAFTLAEKPLKPPNRTRNLNKYETNLLFDFSECQTAKCHIHLTVYCLNFAVLAKLLNKLDLQIYPHTHSLMKLISLRCGVLIETKKLKISENIY